MTQNLIIRAKGHVGLAGYFRVRVLRDGAVREDTGWFPNLITDQGIDWFGGNNPVAGTSYGGNYLNTHCGVGTGNTAPTFADTRLTTFLAMTPSTANHNVEGGTNSYVAGPPPYWSCIWTYDFGTGNVVGNIAEVGVGNCASTDTTPQLFNHALILDSLGNPTTLPITSADDLQVTYELRYYIDTTDNSYSMTISGTTYTGTYRRMAITNAPSLHFPVFGSYNGAATGNATMSVYSGFALGPVTGNPTYTSTTGGFNGCTTTNTAYSSGTYYCEFTTAFSLSEGNISGGISGISTICNHGAYQFSVSPTIPKTSSYTLSVVWHVSWSRY